MAPIAPPQAVQAARRMPPPPPPVVRSGIVQPAFDPGELGAFNIGKNSLDDLAPREKRAAIRALTIRKTKRITAARIRSEALMADRIAQNALNPNGEHTWNIPLATWTTRKIGAQYYKFYNDAGGFINFDAPGVNSGADQTEDGKAVPGGYAYTAIPYAPGANATVNIHSHTLMGIDRMTHPVTGVVSALKQLNRAPHDLVADALRGAAKPAGYTWHHHQTKGRMDLVKSTVHAAFGHRGGFSLWGST